MYTYFYECTFIYLRHVYRFSLSGDEVVTTSADHEGTTVSWPDLEFEFTQSSGSLSYMSLQCTLHYRARLTGDYKVGTVLFPLSSLGIAPMQSEVGLFDCFSDLNSPTREAHLDHNGSALRGKIIPKKVMDATRRVELEGRQSPRCVLSVRLK